MKSPTAKLRSPKTVRLRWKLSVSCAMSASSSGWTRRSPGATSASGGRPMGCSGRRRSRSIPSPRPRMRAAVAMSVTTSSRPRLGETRTGGRSGTASSAATDSGAAKRMPSPVRNAVVSSSSSAGMPGPGGAVTGSTPSTVRNRPPTTICPSTTGVVSQPARRRRTWSAVVIPSPTSSASGVWPSTVEASP